MNMSDNFHRQSSSSIRSVYGNNTVVSDNEFISSLRPIAIYGAPLRGTTPAESDASNVFNILFVVGTTALITPVAFKASFVIDSVVALAAGLLLWFGVMKEQKLKRPVGLIMLAAYAAYFLYLLLG